MPKKKKDEEDSELEELIDEEELEEITQDIEEAVSPEINIDENQFQEFLQIKSFAPVLEEIAGEQELGGRIFFTPGTGRDFEGDDKAFRYDLQTQEDEPKYQGDYSSSNQNLERVEIAKAGREQSQIKEAGFVSSVGQNNPQMQETYREAKAIDIPKAGRKSPFETNLQEAERKKDYVVK